MRLTPDFSLSLSLLRTADVIFHGRAFSSSSPPEKPDSPQPPPGGGWEEQEEQEDAAAAELSLSAL